MVKGTLTDLVSPWCLINLVFLIIFLMLLNFQTSSLLDNKIVFYYYVTVSLRATQYKRLSGYNSDILVFV